MTSSASGLPPTRWPWQAAGLVFPCSAILHHAVFHRQQCMMNPYGADYTWAAVRAWLLTDPSLPWAVVLAGLSFAAGRDGRFAPFMRRVVPPFLLASLPLTLWIWDVPFTGRMICAWGHDARLVLWNDVAVRTWWFYAAGLVLFLLLLVLAWLRRARPAACV